MIGTKKIQNTHPIYIPVVDKSCKEKTAMHKGGMFVDAHTMKQVIIPVLLRLFTLSLQAKFLLRGTDSWPYYGMGRGVELKYN